MDPSVSIRILPSRTYRADAALRRALFTPESVRHPAKGHLELFRDLFRRYTLPGQWVVDPFGGIGGSLVGTVLGRNVVLHELEPPFVDLARGNWAKLRAYADARRGEYLPGVPLGQAVILQGDSRRLPFPDGDGADCAVTSPPFGAMNAPDAGGKVTQRPNRDGVGFEGGREAFLYSESTPGQIGNLPLGDVSAVLSSPPYADAALQQGREKGARGGDAKRRAKQDYAEYGEPTNIALLEHAPAAVISSPPYADLASRDRSAEPYSQAMGPLLKAKWGTGDANRHIDGYGDSPGQIGALPHGVITSPPYGNSFSDWDATSNAAREGQAVLYGDERHSGPRQNIGNIPYYDHEHESKRSPKAPEGAETYADACLAVYRECFRVVRPGGVLVLVTGNYVRDSRMIDLAADTIAIATATGWTPVERWRHEKSTISFWRRLHARQRPDVPVVTWEDVLVFTKGRQGWSFADLEPTAVRPARVRQEPPPSLFDYAEAEGAAS